MIPRASLRPDVFGSLTKLKGSHQDIYSEDPLVSSNGVGETDTPSHPSFHDLYNQHYAPMPPHLMYHSYHHPYGQHILRVPADHYPDPYAYLNTFAYDPHIGNVYPIAPGNRFEIFPREGNNITTSAQKQLDHFEIESVTRDGVPYHVRNISNGERFVVDTPVLRTNEGEDQGGLTNHSNPETPVRRTQASNQLRQSTDRYNGKRFHHQDPDESATSSYTDVSMRTMSGPHFLNDVNYLDNATRSRVVKWLNTSTGIRLRHVDRDNTADAPPPYSANADSRH